jgi:two-component system, OmpR family, response regulator
MLNGLKLLVVDDDQDSRELLIVALESEGAEVIAVGCAEAALSCVRQDSPTLLVSDIRMPDQDGYSMIRQIRAEGKQSLPAIALTAYAHDEDRLEALNAGFQVHLAKPVDLDELVQTILQLVGRSERV